MVLGHGGFMFIGAIAAALITRYFKVSDNLMLNYELQPAGYLQLIICIIGGAIAAGIVGFIVGMPILRLKGDYLAIVTLGFTLIMVSIGNNIVVGSMGDGKGVYINGSQGINGMNTVVEADVLFCVVLMVLCIAGLFLYMKTRFGRSILAIRDDHIAAALCYFLQLRQCHSPRRRRYQASHDLHAYRRCPQRSAQSFLRSRL